MKDIVIGSSSTVADIFGVTAAGGKLTFQKSGLTKTVELADAATGAFAISYSASGQQMYVRNGLSPNLAALMIGGQARMSETAGEKSLAVSTSGGGRTVTATVDVTQGDINSEATDKEDGWNTVNMRNAAQVRYVEVSGTGTLAYTLEFAAGEPEPVEEYIPVGNGVEVPVSWLEEADFPAEWLAERGCEAGDWHDIVKKTASNPSFTVWMCYVAGLDPTDPNSTFEFTTQNTDINGDAISFSVDVPPGRVGKIYSTGSLMDTNGWSIDSVWTNASDITNRYSYTNRFDGEKRFFRKSLEMMQKE